MEQLNVKNLPNSPDFMLPILLILTEQFRKVLLFQKSLVEQPEMIKTGLGLKLKAILVGLNQIRFDFI